MELWFETHATSTDNERGIASGHLNPPLSETGRAQAIELGRRHGARRRFLDEIAGHEGPVILIAHRAPWYALEHLLKSRDLAEVVASPWRWQPGWLYNLALTPYP